MDHHNVGPLRLLPLVSIRDTRSVAQDAYGELPIYKGNQEKKKTAVDWV